jgi:hypothetical protein
MSKKSETTALVVAGLVGGALLFFGYRKHKQCTDFDHIYEDPSSDKLPPYSSEIGEQIDSMARSEIKSILRNNQQPSTGDVDSISEHIFKEITGCDIEDARNKKGKKILEAIKVNVRTLVALANEDKDKFENG